MSDQPPQQYVFRKAARAVLRGGRVLFSWCWRGAAFGLVVFILGVILAFAAAKIFLTPEFLRSEMIASLEKSLDRQVRIQHVNFVLHQGVKVSGFSVSSRRGEQERQVLSSEFLLVKFDPLPLLRGRIAFREVLLMRPEIDLLRYEDGAWDFERALLRSSATPEGGRFILPPLQSARVFSIKEGRLRLRDPIRKLDASFSGISLTAEDFSLNGKFPLSFSFQNESRIGLKGHRAEFDFQGAVELAGLQMSSAAVFAESLEVTVNGKTARLRGHVLGLTAPEADLKIALPSITAEDIGRYLPAPAWIDWPKSDWELRLKPIFSTGTAASPSPRLTAIHIPHLSVESGGVKLGAWGRYRLGDGEITGSVRLSKLVLDRLPQFYPDLKSAEMTGSASGLLSFQGPWAAPSFRSGDLQLNEFGMTFWNGKRIVSANLDFRSRDAFRDWELSVSKGRWLAYENELADVDLHLGVSGGDLWVSRLGLNWRGARLSMKGCIKNARDPKAVFLDGEVDEMPVDEMYAAIERLIVLRREEKGLPPVKNTRWAAMLKDAIPERFPDMAGRLRWKKAKSTNFTTDDFSLEWDLRKISKGLAEVGGRFNISFGPGRMTNLAEIRKSHPLLDLLLIPFVEMHKLWKKSQFSLDTAVPKSLDFAKTSGEFTARGGVIDVDFVHFDSGQFVSFTDGTVDFPREKSNLHVLLRIPKVAENLTPKLKDEAGRPAIDVDLIDDLNSPKVSFNLRSIPADAIENALSRGRTRTAPLAPIEGRLTCGRNP